MSDVSAGKGSRPRPVNQERFAANWDAIDWSKGRESKEEKSQLSSLDETLVRDCTTPVQWQIPTLEQIYGKAAAQWGWDDRAADLSYHPPPDSEGACGYADGWKRQENGGARP